MESGREWTEDVQANGTATAGRMSSPAIEEARELAREAAHLMSMADPVLRARKEGFTKVSDTFMDLFLPLMKRSESNLFLAILRKTRFDAGRMIEFRARELCRAVGISGRFFRLALYRLTEARMVLSEIQGKTWKIMMLPESNWNFESFQNRKTKSH